MKQKHAAAMMLNLFRRNSDPQLCQDPALNLPRIGKGGGTDDRSRQRICHTQNECAATLVRDCYAVTCEFVRIVLIRCLLELEVLTFARRAKPLFQLR